MGALFDFKHGFVDGLHRYVTSLGDGELPGPAWSGLWELEYPANARETPYFRYGVNNADGEDLLVWRAWAWAVTAGRERVVLPTYYRDEAATLLGAAREEVILIPWQYEMECADANTDAADHGFVPGRSCIPVHADDWQRAHRAEAGLFPIASFDELTKIELAVNFDASSEITIFALQAGVDRRDALTSALSAATPPRLSDLVMADEVTVDLSVVRDRFCGMTSRLTVWCHDEISDRVRELADHFEDAYEDYVRRVPTLRNFDDFFQAMDTLIALPGAIR